MSFDQALQLLAAFGHLTLAAIALKRRSTAPLALLLAILAIDCFAWNAADLAEHFSSAPAGWALLDDASSSLTMPLAFHFGLAFLGLAKRLRPTIVVSYLIFGSLALANLAAFVFPAAHAFADSDAWGYTLLALAVVELSILLVLLVRHLRATHGSAERTRAQLVLLALIVGGVVGGTDLWSPIRLGHVGSLTAAVLLAIGVLRFRLLDEKGSAPQLFTGAILAGLALLAYLAAFHYLSAGSAILVLSTLTITAVFALAIGTVMHGAALERERLRYHATFGRWSAQMAHDLKNPLAALRGAIDFLDGEKNAGRSLDAQSDYLPLLREQTMRIDAVVERYRRLSEVRAERQRLPLAPIIERAVAATKMRKLRVEQTIDPSASTCSIDPDLVASAIENLMKNAADASPPDGAIELSVEPRASGICIVVRDRGAGMNPRTLARAGDDFFTTKADGSGLGLAFVRRVAEAHGGSLSIESEEDRGTVVRLDLADAL